MKIVLPIDDVIDHAEENEDCACNPFVTIDNFGGLIIVHNAFDGRQTDEEKGYVDPNKKWKVIVK